MVGGFIDRRKGLGRPTKREGRELARFTEDIYDDTPTFSGIDDLDDEPAPNPYTNPAAYFDFDEDDFND